MKDDKPSPLPNPAEFLQDVMTAQAQAMTGLFGQFAAWTGGAGNVAAAGRATSDPAEAPGMNWAGTAQRLQALWTQYQTERLDDMAQQPSHYTDPSRWVATAELLVRLLPLARPDTQKQLWEEGFALLEGVLGQYGIGPKADEARARPELPRSDPRFADPAWRERPFFAALHQVYLLLAERMTGMAEGIDELDPARRAQIAFATQALVDALSPSNFALTNPVALERALETRGESLVKGMEHLLSDLRRGQLTHTDPTAFKLGENIAVTPGKVVHQTALYQIIQYTPVTPSVYATPLVIFPPWINRFYILDLNARKSFVRWAVEQGISVFMVSWKSADASLAEVVWDDYIAAQIEAVDFVCARLRVPATHVIGYCVAGTTLAAALAVLARKGEAGKIRSATFFTAQVDFEDAGDLKNFVDNGQLDAIARLARNGAIDGRYLAATFNLLRGNDLIWSYVEKNYLRGEDYPAFDLLHWNGDYANLPAKWHCNYLRDMYRDNRLVVPDSMEALGVPIDLRLIETPVYMQAGREDHIAPPQSVWKLTRHIKGPWRFVLAGSGHIAGVVNPPAAGKYQYWTNDAPAETLDRFVDGATEHPGSWWPDWLAWLTAQEPAQVKTRGRRKPGGKGDKVIEDAPGSYVKAR